MKTENIKDIMELNFGEKEEYLESEYASITEISINRFNVVGDIVPIDFNELLYFTNLHNLIIKQCIIDKDIFDIILKLINLKNLYIDDCEVVDDISILFENKKFDTLIFDNINFDISELEKINSNNLYIYNTTLTEDLNLNVLKLDISNCEIKENIHINCSALETLVINSSMYNNINKEINNFHGHLIVMEENGQFIKEERDV